MTFLLKKPARFPAIGIPLLIGMICLLMTRYPGFMVAGDKLSTGITLDCCLTAPLLYMLLVRFRTGRVAVMPVARIFVGGLVLAGFLLQHRPHTLLQILRTWVFPLVEAGVLGMIVVRFYKARAAFKGSVAFKVNGAGNADAGLGNADPGQGSVDFLPFCRSMLQAITGNKLAGNLIGSELAVVYYSFLGKKDNSVDYRASFSSYKQNGILLVLGVFLGLFAVEITATHLLVGLWSVRAAWIMTILGVYTMLQLFAHMRAIRARPLVIGESFLLVRNGLVADATLLFDNIASINRVGRRGEVRDGVVKLGLLGALEGHNIIVQLKEPVVVTRLFGKEALAHTVLFFVDQPGDFMQAIDNKGIKVG